jgi:hypothetical protein
MSPHASWSLVHEVVPRIASSVPRVVRFVGSEDEQEIIQDATAMAAKMLINAEAAGKQVTPGNIAYYTLQHMKSGRRSVGHSNADVLGSATQLHGRSHVSSFDEPIMKEESETFTMDDVFCSEQEDPSVAAARKMDWEEFCLMQDECNRAIVIAIAEGESVRQLSSKFRLSASSLQNRKQKLALAILEFMGVDVLTESIRQPSWRNGIVASREKSACRIDRC